MIQNSGNSHDQVMAVFEARQLLTLFNQSLQRARALGVIVSVGGANGFCVLDQDLSVEISTSTYLSIETP